MPSKPISKTSALLEAMKRSPSGSSQPAPEPPVKMEISTESIASPKAQPSGRRENYKLVYFTNEDRAALSEKMVWVASQGIRPSDSLILRAALRVAKLDQAFREALDTILREDKRTRKARALAGR